MPYSSEYVDFKVAFQLSPIIFGPHGIADSLGGAVPIVYFTDGYGSLNQLVTTASSTASTGVTAAAIQTIGGAAGGALGALATSAGTLYTSTPAVNLDAFFANYEPLPGSSLVDNQAATYPFANQGVAANALIPQPLTISMLMKCPARNSPNSYSGKWSKMGMLQKAFTTHNNLGGLYSIATPAFLYSNCVMTGMRDVSQGQSKQYQYIWQLDFLQPLVTLGQAQQAQAGLMAQITNGVRISGTPSWSGGAGLSIANPYQILNSSVVQPGTQ